VFANTLRRLSLRLKPLPPGALCALDDAERLDRRVLMARSAAYGDVFKGQLEGQLAVFVVGLTRGRQLLREHHAELQATTIDITPLVPGGFMRQMLADMHRKYRRGVMQALQATDLSLLLADLQTHSQAVLHEYAMSRRFGPDDLMAQLNRIATTMLVRHVLGSAGNPALEQRLCDHFQALGPWGLVWNPRQAQHTAFQRLVETLEEAFERLDDNSVLGQALRQGTIDQTLLGNLIYMVEMGRYDLRALFRWLLWYAARGNTSLATEEERQAFVLETLRTDQSERLMRRVLQDIEFAGYRIPKGALVRICMWEAHHDPQVFDLPLVFDQQRFRGRDVSPQQFSPFGLDQHQCPFGDGVIRMGTTFLAALARFDVTAVGDGPAIRGAYHWEPASQFSVRLVPKEPS